MRPPRRARDPDLEASSSGDDEETTRRDEQGADASAAARCPASDSVAAGAGETTTSASSSSKGNRGKTDELSREWEARRARFYNVSGDSSVMLLWK